MDHIKEGKEEQRGRKRRMIRWRRGRGNVVTLTWPRD
jgi:hypothetical protein